MMFKLRFPIPPSDRTINLKDPILLSGSCFSDSIGDHLSRSKFNVLANPFGTLYNPISLFHTLEKGLDQDGTVEHEGVWYHWQAHGAISALSHAELLNTCSTTNAQSQTMLKQAKWLVLTLGTSHVYEHPSAGVVANCHRIPQSTFTKRLLKVDEIIEGFTSLHSMLTKVNPSANIILTVSPVRHIRDGLIENNRSKSILIQAVHQLVDAFENVQYFPSYEILIDELRDYRFYAEDYVHPSKQAIDYIWEQFSRCYLDADTQAFIESWNKIRQALNHRPFHPQSPAHQQFIKETLNKLKRLSNQADFSKEIEQLREQLA